MGKFPLFTVGFNDIVSFTALTLGEVNFC